MTFDVAAFRSEFPSLASGIAHFDNPGGTQTPAVVGDAIARTLTGPLSQRGSALVSQHNAEQSVADFRSAVADLVGGVPGGVVHGRSATALTYDFSRTLAKTWTAGRRGRALPARPRLQRAAVGPGRRARRGHRPLAAARPGDRRARPVRPRRGGQRAHPAGRAHRRLQPARHPPAGRHGRRAARTRSAHWSTSTACTTPPTRLPTSPRWAPTCWSARPTSSSGPTAPRSSRTRRCWRPCVPTSSCRRPTSCPNASSSARCPTRCSPA